MTKPTARMVWQQLLDEAGEDAIASVLALSPEQVQAELAGLGLDAAAERAKADRFLDDLTAGAASAASATSPLQAALKPLPRVVAATPRKRPRTALVLLAAATTAAAAGALAYSALHPPPAPPEPPPQPAPPAPPTTPTPPVVPDLVAAAQWRDKAVAACNAAQWEECLTDLDRARALDAAGDETPLVKSTRDRAIRGLTGKPQ